MESADNFEQVDAMKLEEIAAQIEVKYRDWGNDRIATLDEIASNPDIAARISRFIEEASRDKRATSEKTPVEMVKTCIKLASVANFRFGLLVGLMLDRPSDFQFAGMDVAAPESDTTVAMIKHQCERCVSTGQVCFECNKTKFDCTCGLGKFSPTVCLNCDGEGYVA